MTPCRPRGNFRRPLDSPPVEDDVVVDDRFRPRSPPSSVPSQSKGVRAGLLAATAFPNAGLSAGQHVVRRRESCRQVPYACRRPRRCTGVPHPSKPGCTSRTVPVERHRRRRSVQGRCHRRIARRLRSARIVVLHMQSVADRRVTLAGHVTVPVADAKKRPVAR